MGQPLGYNRYSRKKDTRAPGTGLDVVSGVYSKNLTFSGCDIIPIVYQVDPKTQEGKLFVIGDIATLTYSIHQEKGAVRTLGRQRVKGFTRGQETVAGTMIFNMFNVQALWQLARDNRNIATGKTRTLTQLPPFNVVLYFENEAGHQASLAIFGIQFADEGQSHSVEDTYVENTSQFVAEYIEPLDPIYQLPGLEASFMAANREKLDDIKRSRRRNLPFDYTYLPPAIQEERSRELL